MDRRQCEGRRHLITLPFLILHLLFIADQAYTSSSSPPLPSLLLPLPPSSSSLQHTVLDPQHNNTLLDLQHTHDTTATTNTDDNKKAEVHDDLELKTATENTNKKYFKVHKDLKLKVATQHTSTKTDSEVHKDLEPKTNNKTDSEVHKDLEFKDATQDTSTQTDSKAFQEEIEAKTNDKTDSEVFYEDLELKDATEPTTTTVDSEVYDDLEPNELEDRRRRSLDDDDDDDDDDDGIHSRQSREKTYVPFNSLTFMTEGASPSSSSSDINWVPTDRVKVKQQVENSKLGGRKPVSSTIRPVVTTLTTFPYVVHNWKTSQGQSHPITAAATDVTEASTQVTETTTNSPTGFTEDFTDLTDFFIQTDGEYGQRTPPGFPFHNTEVTVTGTDISTTPPPTFPDRDTTVTEQQSTYNPHFLPTVLLPDPQDAINTGQDTSSVWSGTSEHSSSSTGHSNPTHIPQQKISEESDFSTQPTTTGILSTNWEPLYETNDNTQQNPWEATPQVLSDSGSIPRWTSGIFEVQGTTLEESGLVTWIPEVTDFLSPEQSTTTVRPEQTRPPNLRPLTNPPTLIPTTTTTTKPPHVIHNAVVRPSFPIRSTPLVSNRITTLLTSTRRPTNTQHQTHTATTNTQHQTHTATTNTQHQTHTATTNTQHQTHTEATNTALSTTQTPLVTWIQIYTTLPPPPPVDSASATTTRDRVSPPNRPPRPPPPPPSTSRPLTSNWVSLSSGPVTSTPSWPQTRPPSTWSPPTTRYPPIRPPTTRPPSTRPPTTRPPPTRRPPTTRYPPTPPPTTTRTPPTRPRPIWLPTPTRPPTTKPPPPRPPTTTRSPPTRPPTTTRSPPPWPPTTTQSPPTRPRPTRPPPTRPRPTRPPTTTRPRPVWLPTRPLTTTTIYPPTTRPVTRTTLAPRPTSTSFNILTEHPVLDLLHSVYNNNNKPLTQATTTTRSITTWRPPYQPLEDVTQAPTDNNNNNNNNNNAYINNPSVPLYPTINSPVIPVTTKITPQWTVTQQQTTTTTTRPSLVTSLLHSIPGRVPPTPRPQLVSPTPAVIQHSVQQEVVRDSPKVPSHTNTPDSDTEVNAVVEPSAVSRPTPAPTVTSNQNNIRDQESLIIDYLNKMSGIYSIKMKDDTTKNAEGTVPLSTTTETSLLQEIGTVWVSTRGTTRPPIAAPHTHDSTPTATGVTSAGVTGAQHLTGGDNTRTNNNTKDNSQSIGDPVTDILKQYVDYNLYETDLSEYYALYGNYGDDYYYDYVNVHPHENATTFPTNFTDLEVITWPYTIFPTHKPTSPSTEKPYEPLSSSATELVNHNNIFYSNDRPSEAPHSTVNNPLLHTGISSTAAPPVPLHSSIISTTPPSPPSSTFLPLGAAETQGPPLPIPAQLVGNQSSSLNDYEYYSSVNATPSGFVDYYGEDYGESLPWGQIEDYYYFYQYYTGDRDDDDNNEAGSAQNEDNILPAWYDHSSTTTTNTPTTTTRPTTPPSPLKYTSTTAATPSNLAATPITSQHTTTTTTTTTPTTTRPITPPSPLKYTSTTATTPSPSQHTTTTTTTTTTMSFKPMITEYETPTEVPIYTTLTQSLPSSATPSFPHHSNTPPPQYLPGFDVFNHLGGPTIRPQNVPPPTGIYPGHTNNNINSEAVHSLASQVFGFLDIGYLSNPPPRITTTTRRPPVIYSPIVGTAGVLGRPVSQGYLNKLPESQVNTFLDVNPLRLGSFRSKPVQKGTNSLARQGHTTNLENYREIFNSAEVSNANFHLDEQTGISSTPTLSRIHTNHQSPLNVTRTNLSMSTDDKTSADQSPFQPNKSHHLVKSDQNQRHNNRFMSRLGIAYGTSTFHDNKEGNIGTTLGELTKETGVIHRQVVGIDKEVKDVKNDARNVSNEAPSLDEKVAAYVSDPSHISASYYYPLFPPFLYSANTPPTSYTNNHDSPLISSIPSVHHHHHHHPSQHILSNLPLRTPTNPKHSLSHPGSLIRYPSRPHSAVNMRAPLPTFKLPPPPTHLRAPSTIRYPSIINSLPSQSLTHTPAKPETEKIPALVTHDNWTAERRDNPNAEVVTLDTIAALSSSIPPAVLGGLMAPISPLSLSPTAASLAPFAPQQKAPSTTETPRPPPPPPPPPLTQLLLLPQTPPQTGSHFTTTTSPPPQQTILHYNTYNPYIQFPDTGTTTAPPQPQHPHLSNPGENVLTDHDNNNNNNNYNNYYYNHLPPHPHNSSGLHNNTQGREQQQQQQQHVTTHQQHHHHHQDYHDTQHNQNYHDSKHTQDSHDNIHPQQQKDNITTQQEFHNHNNNNNHNNHFSSNPNQTQHNIYQQQQQQQHQNNTITHQQQEFHNNNNHNNHFSSNSNQTQHNSIHHNQQQQQHQDNTITHQQKFHNKNNHNNNISSNPNQTYHNTIHHHQQQHHQDNTITVHQHKFHNNNHNNKKNSSNPNQTQHNSIHHHQQQQQQQQQHHHQQDNTISQQEFHNHNNFSSNPNQTYHNGIHHYHQQHQANHDHNNHNNNSSEHQSGLDEGSHQHVIVKVWSVIEGKLEQVGEHLVPHTMFTNSSLTNGDMVNPEDMPREVLAEMSSKFHSDSVNLEHWLRNTGSPKSVSISLQPRHHRHTRDTNLQDTSLHQHSEEEELNNMAMDRSTGDELKNTQKDLKDINPGHEFSHNDQDSVTPPVLELHNTESSVDTTTDQGQMKVKDPLSRRAEHQQTLNNTNFSQIYTHDLQNKNSSESQRTIFPKDEYSGSHKVSNVDRSGKTLIAYNPTEKDGLNNVPVVHLILPQFPNSTTTTFRGPSITRVETKKNHQGCQNLSSRQHTHHTPNTTTTTTTAMASSTHHHTTTVNPTSRHLFSQHSLGQQDTTSPPPIHLHRTTIPQHEGQQKYNPDILLENDSSGYPQHDAVGTHTNPTQVNNSNNNNQINNNTTSYFGGVGNPTYNNMPLSLGTSLQETDLSYINILSNFVNYLKNSGSQNPTLQDAYTVLSQAGIGTQLQLTGGSEGRKPSPSVTGNTGTQPTSASILELLPQELSKINPLLTGVTGQPREQTPVDLRGVLDDTPSPTTLNWEKLQSHLNTLTGTNTFSGHLGNQGYLNNNQHAAQNSQSGNYESQTTFNQQLARTEPSVSSRTSPSPPPRALPRGPSFSISSRFSPATHFQSSSPHNTDNSPILDTATLQRILKTASYLALSTPSSPPASYPTLPPTTQPPVQYVRVSASSNYVHPGSNTPVNDRPNHSFGQVNKGQQQSHTNFVYDFNYFTQDATSTSYPTSTNKPPLTHYHINTSPSFPYHHVNTSPPPSYFQTNTSPPSYQVSTSPSSPYYQPYTSPPPYYQPNTSPHQYYQPNTSPPPYYQPNTSPAQYYQPNTSPAQYFQVQNTSPSSPHYHIITTPTPTSSTYHAIKTKPLSFQVRPFVESTIHVPKYPTVPTTTTTTTTAYPIHTGFQQYNAFAQISPDSFVSYLRPPPPSSSLPSSIPHYAVYPPSQSSVVKPPDINYLEVASSGQLPLQNPGVLESHSYRPSFSHYNSYDDSSFTTTYKPTVTTTTTTNPYLSSASSSSSSVSPSDNVTADSFISMASVQDCLSDNPCSLGVAAFLALGISSAVTFPFLVPVFLGRRRRGLDLLTSLVSQSENFITDEEKLSTLLDHLPFLNSDTNSTLSSGTTDNITNTTNSATFDTNSTLSSGTINTSTLFTSDSIANTTNSATVTSAASNSSPNVYDTAFSFLSDLAKLDSTGDLTLDPHRDVIRDRLERLEQHLALMGRDRVMLLMQRSLRMLTGRTGSKGLVARNKTWRKRRRRR
ncbi:hypothetical protein Pmani_032121 [Petrolisthes manimaculis]|uniref:Uncharacterized protein n=1 Tax=Petrolisthes manimaculis TaxID=1843537 RepID=A0AAE1TU38_9EUCA|nr:hypothetical protein Pmani_032121 [Petrolisthes manimaculis]